MHIVNKKWAVGGLMLASMATASCASGSWFRNGGYPQRIAISPTDRAVVMPADLHVHNGGGLTTNLSFMGGIASACGTNCVPAQPLLPLFEAAGLNDLSWILAEGMYHAASVHHGETWDHAYTRIPGLLGGLFTAINSAFPGANIRYIMVGHVDQLGAGMVPHTTNLRVLGGMYDIQQHRIATVFWYEQTMPEDTMVANIGLMGARIVDLSTCPSSNCPAVAHAQNDRNIHNFQFVTF